MKIADLKEYFDDAKSNSIRFVGGCYDCEKIISIDIDYTDKKLVIIGGAVYKDEGKTFLKCDECFKKEATLKNYKECEVYSRVVGYLRPIKQWNPGKKAEYDARKNFKINSIE